MRDSRIDFLPYIAEADGNLRNLTYEFIKFKDKGRGDHVHCELCWVIICENDHIKGEKEGYYCKETGCWLCKKCFFDFAEEYNWKII